VGTQLASAVESDVVEVVVKALHRATEPFAASRLRQDLTGPYKLTEKRLEPLLEELAAQGRIHRFEPARKGGKPRYLSRDLDQYAREVILGLLSNDPLTLSELKKKRANKLKELPEQRFVQILNELQTSGQVHRVPPLGKKRSEQLSTRKPDLRVYVDEALTTLHKKLATSGITRQQIDEAARRLLLPEVTQGPVEPQGFLETPGGTASGPLPPGGGGFGKGGESAGEDIRAVDSERPPHPAGARPPSPARGEGKQPPSNEARVETDAPLPLFDEPDLAERILERMSHVNPAAANGALISLRDLRRSMDFQGLDKPAFDRAVLRLADQGRVALHRHDYPWSLSDEEKAEMVPDGRGGYYVGIAQRI
jgi:DNA-binding HxlR family transcriptional regulator